ncbi:MULTISPECIES: LysR family transcriptional regulator [Rhizobium/Agrobacterium group]|uniref:LysR family transcriptional regulator n=1 Tax=Rhizobium/Agrobacterium group TaxID=227290 RepID=UPI00110DDE46|nr:MULTISPECIES: LysR family transcriptional regulator [Rhizobium/Agrobacterium group]NWJ22845.1 LysR family transcriptional regulator [Rhizobium sp. RM]TMV12256.1 LysR family transcriptional regulator [Rhizobium sp. Td3]UXS00784.1 LysR family transcriptional regulator [Agrobacterium tumefaciens]
MDANPTLDQLQVFLTVAETGSFSAASRALNRAQSVVSYTIANLEAQLEVTLFERNGVRQPRLTDEGRAMLEDARRIVAGLQEMRARAKGLKQGLEAELSVAISTMVPAEAVVAVLRDFRRQFPTIGLSLNVGELGMVMDMVLSRKADIGIGGALLRQDDELVTEKIGHSFLLPVIAADHPLAQIERPLVLADVREEVQLVVTDASGLTKGRDFNVLSYKTWKVSDIATKYQLIKGGLGWGGLPASLVRNDLVNGGLKVLDLDAYEQGEYPLFALRRLDTPAGPAGTWLMEAFQTRLSQCPNQKNFHDLIEAGTDKKLKVAAE